MTELERLKEMDKNGSSVIRLAISADIEQLIAEDQVDLANDLVHLLHLVTRIHNALTETQ